jgi:hypothetical protein
VFPVITEHQLIGVLVVGICVFALVQLVIICAAMKQNESYWLEKAGGDPQKARALKKHNWKFENKTDFEFEIEIEEL